MEKQWVKAGRVEPDGRGGGKAFVFPHHGRGEGREWTASGEGSAPEGQLHHGELGRWWARKLGRDDLASSSELTLDLNGSPRAGAEPPVGISVGGIGPHR